MAGEKMSSRELGLVLAQQLLDVEDLHYGLWSDELPLSLSGLAEAQQRYTDRILAALPAPEQDQTTVLDIGCGTGGTLVRLLDRGYRADGLVPAPDLAAQVRKRLSTRPGNRARLFEQTFERFPAETLEGYYDAALFSESFQYIPMADSFRVLRQILKPGGHVVIGDFFRTEHAGDGGRGDRSFGGGHPLQAFYDELTRQPFTLLEDTDITRLVSPTIRLLDETLTGRLVPAGRTLDRYLSSNHPRTWRAGKAIVRRLFRKKLEKLNYKYFSGHRSQEVFERYKSYRLLVLQRNSRP